MQYFDHMATLHSCKSILHRRVTLPVSTLSVVSSCPLGYSLLQFFQFIHVLYVVGVSDRGSASVEVCGQHKNCRQAAQLLVGNCHDASFLAWYQENVCLIVDASLSR